MKKPDTDGARTYVPRLGLRRTERAIKVAKDSFETAFESKLNLTRVSAPVAVLSGTGVNDHLDGVQQPVRFGVKALGAEAEVVQSLAKWKRAALADYGFAPGEGLLTDMNALRPDESLDRFHSVYVDQWDWEKVMAPEQRSVASLKNTVRAIYEVIRDTERMMCLQFPELEEPFLPDDIRFVHSQDLENAYPDLSPRQRETEACREHGAVFVIGIGAPLASGKPHEARAADYDDWITAAENGKPGLNGDILVWYPILECAMELSSMGIRVSPESLLAQLAAKGETAKQQQPFHKRLLAEGLPQSIGGGIGQSRLCMLFLRKAHIGEVQVGIWPEQMREACRTQGIPLL